MPNKVIRTEVVVLGSGPGGYTSAFRAADLGKQVVLVEYYPNIGGVCLNVGCIPSKALLHAAKVMAEVEEAKTFGLNFSDMQIDLAKLRDWKDKIIYKLTSGLRGLAKQRKVEIIPGYGKFINSNTLEVEKDGDITQIEFTYAIIAAGSAPVKLPFLPADPRIIDSTGALALTDIPDSMLIIGGGIIGMELGTVYSALGSKVSVVELTSGLLPGVDRDLVAPLQKRLDKKFASIMLETKITKVEAAADGLWASFEGKNAPAAPQRFAKILSCVGRTPNGKLIGADQANIHVDERGFILVDSQLRTNVPHIFAIGDISGNPMLAHKALPEGKIAAEVIAGKHYFFEPKCIPAVAYTDPEIAWVGVTEEEAKSKNINYDKGVFPWAASGRSLTNGRDEGLTKVIFNKDTNKVIGAGIVGTNAGDLITEVALAIEMGCEAEDLALTIHPHPTLSETVCQATEAFEGTLTDLYLPKKKTAGFSLIEMLIVITIIGILSAVAIPAYKKYVLRSQYMEGVNLLQNCMKKVQVAYVANEAFPSQECGVSKGSYSSINSAAINTLFYDYDTTKAWMIVNFNPSVIPTGNRDLHIGGMYSATADRFVTLCGRWSSAYFTGGDLTLLPASCNDANVSADLLSM